MITIYFKVYKTEEGLKGTAYYNDKDCLQLKAKNPYKEHRVNHIATINCCKYYAEKVN